MMHAVVAMSRTQASIVLDHAVALYPVNVVCNYLLQPVLISTSELCQNDLLPSTALSFVHIIIRSFQPYLVEACLSPEQANQYLQQFISTVGNIPLERQQAWQELSPEERAQQGRQLIAAIGSQNESIVQQQLSSLFSNYPVEAVCSTFLQHVFLHIDNAIEAHTMSFRTGQWGKQILYDFLTFIFALTPDISGKQTVLIGTSPGNVPDITGLILALYWRRMGFRVYYAGQFHSLQTVKQAVHTYQPALFYVVKTSPDTIDWMMSLEREIQNHQGEIAPLLCFGGTHWKYARELLGQVPGIYLGVQVEEIAHLLGELAHLLPTLSLSQRRTLLTDRTLFIQHPEQKEPVFEHNQLVMVGCVPQKTAEFDALRLTLLWRRMGLRVSYIGQVNNEQALMRQVEKNRPMFVFLVATSRVSTHWIARVGEVLTLIEKKDRPFLCFGGSAFAQTPLLARSIDGFYLGVQPTEITYRLAEATSLTTTLSMQQVEELLAPNSFRASFQQEMKAATTQVTVGEEHSNTIRTPQGNAVPTAHSISTTQQRAEDREQIQQAKSVFGWKGTLFYPGFADIQQALPGLFFVVLPLTLLAETIWLLELRLHATFFVDIFIAAVLALILANVVSLPERVQSGLNFSTRWCLRLGILCYAFKFSYQPLLQSGLQNLAIVTFSVTLSLGASLIIGRILVMHPRIASLIGVGTGICGISAVMATAPSINARDEETAVALGTILCWGTAGLLFYPFIGNMLHLSPAIYGVWTGATIHDLPQLIATAQQGGGTAALKAALFVKLIRVTFIVVVVLLLNVSFQIRERRKENTISSNTLIQSIVKTFPLFVLAFFFIVFINTVTTIPLWLTGPLATWPVTTFPTTVSNILLMFAIIGICARINRSAFKTAGIKALLLGMLTWMVQSISVLLIAHLLLH
jgi:uncharacterized integral membrane protein (TIGR00698 family)